MNHLASHTNFSVYLVPAAFATLSLATCLCTILAASYLQSAYHNSWNILYDIKQDFKKQFIYIFRLVYYYHKSTVDFSKTSYILHLVQAFSGTEISFRIPARFLDPNQHNTFTAETGIIRFLLIRDTELELISKIGITHDHQGGELNLALVNYQESTKPDGHIALFEQAIQAISLEEVKKRQNRKTTMQSKMELEGDFAVTEGISAAEFIGPLYMYAGIISAACTEHLTAYYKNWDKKPSYTGFQSLREATFIGVGYFFFLFGLTSLAFALTKHLLKGQPRPYKLILHLYTALCIVVGIGFSLSTVSKMDPNAILFTLKDADLVPHFISLWTKAVTLDVALAVCYGFPFVIFYFILIKLLFRGYEC